MDLSEYVYLSGYLSTLKEESKNNDLITIKPKEFYTVMSSVLSKYKDVLVRDYLDIDGTFSIIFKKYQSVFDVLDCYQSVKEVLLTMLYADEFDYEGLIKFSEYEGFWVRPSV